jgi:hypothetical protein
VATARQRLASLGWFVKCLKEPLARMANREEGVRGAFFEGRFKSVAVLDEESLLATCVYIDLNLGAAGDASVTKASKHTSIKQRVAHAKSQSRTKAAKAAPKGSSAARARAAGQDKSDWLCPIDDRRGRKSSREGMLPGVSLASYLVLVEYSARLLHKGKAPLPKEVAAIFEPLEITEEWWHERLLRLSQGRLMGRFAAANRDRLRETAASLGVHRLTNLG